jgi:hypothetical protein
MDRDNPIEPPKRRYKNGVVVALDICDTKRAEESGLTPAAAPNGSDDKREALLRTAAIVQAAAAKLNANDFTALEAVCASHVLALDVIFNEFARDAARVEDYLSRSSMATALRAQSQCRATLKTLASLTAKKKLRNFDEQTDGNANRPAPSDAWEGQKSGAAGQN